MRLIWIHLGLLTLYCFVFVDSAPDNKKKAEKKCPTLSLPGGRVRYRSGKKYASFNCIPTLTLVGSQVAVCTEGEWSVPVPKCIGSTCDKPKVDANVVVEDYSNGGWLHFFCRSGYIREGPEDIYCIGTKWNNDPPTCKAGTSNGCDFEDGLCGWSHDLTDDFNWVINQGETPTAKTGPMVDHTKNDSSGHYLFVESSAPQTTGHKARFLSPFYNVESLQNKCLEFYYHMYGEEGENNVGSLEVYVRPQKIPTIALDTDHQIFYKTGNQRDSWIKADVIVPQVTEPVQFVFQATMKKSWLSDIAIDDIVVTDCRSKVSNSTDHVILNDSFTTVYAKSSPRRTAVTSALTQAVTKPIRTTPKGTRSTRQTTMSTTKPSTATTKAFISTTRPTTLSTKSSTPMTLSTTVRTTVSTLAPKTMSTTLKTITTSSSTPRTTTMSTSITTTASISTAEVTSEKKSEITSEAASPKTAETSGPRTVSPSGEFTPETENNLTPDVPGDSVTPNTTDAGEADETEKDYTDMNGLKPSQNGDDEGDEEEVERTTSQLVDMLDNETSDADDDHDDDEKTSTTEPSGSNASAGKVHGGDEGSGMKELLPLIIGVVSAVVVGAVVIGVLTWRWAKHQRMKQQKEEDDQMNIITEYVETTLNV
ncbi:MAM and LDL-receptor class A domain-containing protein 1 [Biomphalaria pfeifferi]|uniref:MAM and LDL-receptor class A domain-containing protein 1 n=1 Tax=Biomphalaria pfeifferi TaxID=112525 RepID=A0AAD8BH77_BIOPF|nr:MAM and LDL-receptor class A domain-containing protein 1 [Biomphalaria pfeifferi]